MSYQSEQDAFVRRCNIKVGSKVKVIRTALSGERGWPNTWVSPEMNEAVGQTGFVSYIDEEGASGISVRFEPANAVSGCYFPFFVLKRVI